MSLLKLPLLLASIGATTLVASAQKAPASNPANSSFTVVDANGNLIRNTRPRMTPAAEPVAEEATPTASSDRSRRGRDRHDTIRSGTTYFVPAPYYPYPYPYPAPAYNNFYFPEQPTTTVIGTTRFPWQRPTTITTIPQGGYYGGYPVPGYPTYPAYGYPAPGYGYPVPTYGYPGVPYPAYGTTTYVYGNAPGSVYSQSQTGGYGFSIGNGGISIQLGKNRSSSQTTVTHY